MRLTHPYNIHQPVLRNNHLYNVLLSYPHLPTHTNQGLILIGSILNFAETLRN